MLAVGQLAKCSRRSVTSRHTTTIPILAFLVKQWTDAEFIDIVGIHAQRLRQVEFSRLFENCAGGRKVLPQLTADEFRSSSISSSAQPCSRR